MEELFNVLSSSARLKKKPKKRDRDGESSQHHELPQTADPLRHSEEKQQQIHREQIAAFRRSMNIKLANKHDPTLPDPISSFSELSVPSWWASEERDFSSLYRTVQRNIEAGKWKEPTPIQMQALPSLLQRRDLIGSAPTGSGKSGAFIIPSLLLAGASHTVFYGVEISSSKKKKKKPKDDKQQARQGEIRGLLLAPSLELASQLYREVVRLSMGLPGGNSSLLLSKSNASQVISGNAGGKKGLDILVATPLRLVDCIEKGLKLNGVRVVCLDEADRLLDAADGKRNSNKAETASGSAQSKTFLAQMDAILADIPSTAVRALFSATVTPTVRSLSESILRNPVDITIQAVAAGGVNPDVEQELMFVGREEGKLLAIRQLVQRGQLRPPVIVFLDSQDRAQALFSELLYDGIHVDVIHAGRSKSARENAVAKFRRGDTWVLICTDLVARGVDFRAVNMVINYDLPESGITYVHRIGRCGRAGRKGKAITLFTESDFEHLRTIANIMKQSGCKVEDWMLNLPKKHGAGKHKSAGLRRQRRREGIDTTPRYDKMKRKRRQQIIEQNKRVKQGGWA